MTSTTFSINKYLPVVLLYFFFNSFLLPHGLLYTTILTPLFIIWLYKFPSFKYVWWFFIVLAPFIIVHLINGVNLVYYAKSLLLLFSIHVFVITLYQFLTVCKTLRSLYKNILLINIPFTVLALVALSFPALKEIFWYSNEITSGVKTVRLQMLTYEPSYYSTLLVPIALYYYLKILMRKLQQPILIFLLLTIPLLLSLSFGVILGLLLSIFLTTLSDFNTFFPNKKLPIYFLTGALVIALGIIFFVVIFPDNVFAVRFTNVLSGKDSSFRGRTFDSFVLGWHFAGEKSLLFGCGPGQSKVVGLEFFRIFYSHNAFTTENVAIPNVLGDTLATFGIIGLTIRMLAEIVLFFKTRVYSNYYRLGLFLYIFIYQFTGSFITNIAEYTIWVLAFHSAAFKEFDRVPRSLQKHPSNNQ